MTKEAAPAALDLETSWSFEADVVTHVIAAKKPTPTSRSLHYTVVWLPEKVAAELPLDVHPRLRVHAVVGEVPVDGAFQPSGGRWYLMLSKPLLKQAALRLGDRTEVRFSLADPDAVDVPDALQAALSGRKKAAKAFAALSAGKKRALCHHVASAKRAPTQQRRVDDVISVLTGGRPKALARFSP
jgi:hypothetical protein